MASYFQICARCTRRIDVGPSPRQWCPLCLGVLLSPVEIGVGAPVAGRSPARNFRWTVTRPPSTRPRRARITTPSPTPSYSEIPRWGLPIGPPPDTSERPTAVDRLAGRAPSLLRLTAVLYVVAAIAELARYILLLVSRGSLIDPVVLALSDASVWCLSFLAVGFGLVTAVATVGWLVRAREHAYGEQGREDPRRPRTLYLGSLVPIVNLLMTGVFLTEFARAVRHRLRVEKLVPWWWSLWIANWILLIVTVLVRRMDGIQALANGVLLTMVTDLVAAGLALLSLVVIRRSQNLSLSGDDRRLTRWTVVSATKESAPPEPALR